MKIIASQHRFTPAMLAAASLAWLPTPSAEAAPGDALGPPFRVDDTGETLGLTAVASSANGDFMIAWCAPAMTGEALRPYARLYSAEGTAKTSPFPLDPRVGGVDSDEFLVGIGLGPTSAAAVWQRRDENFDVVIEAQRLGSDGTLKGSPLLVAKASMETPSPAMAMDEDGDFIVSWNSFHTVGIGIPPFPYPVGDIGYSSVHARRYGGDGSAGPDRFVQLAPLRGNYEYQPTIAAINGNGDYLVGWPVDVGPLRSANMRRYTASGVPLTLTTSLERNLLKPALQAAVLADDGSAIVAYNQAHPTGSHSYSGYDIYLQRYSALGVRQGAPILATDQVVIEDASLAHDASGNLVVAWVGSSSGYCCVPRELYFQLIAADGSLRGSSHRVEGFGSGTSARVASDAQGNFVISWSQNQTIMAQRFSGH